ncbi:MAG: response regulator [Acetatifactor sp.]|nr:response regulator [Acetatifactor sp.]
MGSKALIVDDIRMNRQMLFEILQDEYEVLQAENGKQALQILEEHNEDIVVVLLDLVMPELDGYGVLTQMRERKWQERIPVLVISSEEQVEAEEKCFRYGVSDFIKKPYYKQSVKNRVRNIVELFQYKNRLEEKVQQQTSMLSWQNELLRQQTEKLRKNNMEIIDVLGTVVESRNLESGQHIKRIRGFSSILANMLMEAYPEYGLTGKKVEMISAASALHDVGKIAIPDAILLKPGRLTAEEYEYMKSHSVRGCELVENIKDIWEEDYAKLSYDICRYHHERYDGKGYPDGLVGEDIPIAAQIVSVADVYDALVSKRVYKDAYGKEQAFQMIVNGECGAFSPKILKCFRMVRKSFEQLADSQIAV